MLAGPHPPVRRKRLDRRAVRSLTELALRPAAVDLGPLEQPDWAAGSRDRRWLFDRSQRGVDERSIVLRYRGGLEDRMILGKVEVTE